MGLPRSGPANEHGRVRKEMIAVVLVVFSTGSLGGYMLLKVKVTGDLVLHTC